MNFHFRFFQAVLIVLVLSLWAGQPEPAAQANGGGWKRPQGIPGLVETTPDQYPVFVAEPTGKLHVFHSQFVRGNLVILHSSWNSGVGWTNPVDVILSPVGQARLIGAFLDNAGMMNVFFWGGEEGNADMYFTQAPIQQVDSTTAWTQPVMIGTNAITPTSAAVVSDGQGLIVLVYSGNEEGNGLYNVNSYDGGLTWTAPTPIFLAASDLLWPSAIQMIYTDDNKVYAVWGLGDITGNSRNIHFAAWDGEQRSWNSPVVLANAVEFEADTPSIIEHDGGLMVIYHNDFPTTRWMVRSSDGGETWTAPARLFDHVGSNGRAELVEDGAGRLHMLFGNRVGTPPTHGLWHSQWINNAWSVPEPIVSGPQIRAGENGEEGFDPSMAQAVVLRGNLLFVAWRHDPVAGPKHVWYTYTTLDAPEILPTPSPTTAVEDLPTVVASAETQAAPAIDEPTPNPAFDNEGTAVGMENMSLLMLYTTIPVLFLVIVFVIIKGRQRS